MKLMDPSNAAPIARPAAVAGMFYPSNPEELRRMIADYLGPKPPVDYSSFKAFVLPHAGYPYSGPIAGTGYRHLWAEQCQVKRLVLLGPSHRVGFRGLAISHYDAFDTPLGPVPVDHEAIELIRGLPQIVELDEAHQGEHSLEVHLPFLRMILGNFKLVPLVVGDAKAAAVAEVLDLLWGGQETRIVISSDLSHYHEYDEATILDKETARWIQRFKRVTPEQACGAIPLDGLLHTARKRGMSVRLLDLRNSGDTAGLRDRVVGYGAFGFAENKTPPPEAREGEASSLA